MRVCSVEGCDRPFLAKNLCKQHYRTTVNDSSQLCSAEGCVRKKESRSLCSAHYRRLLRKNAFDPLDKFDHDGVCSIDGCNKPFLAKKLCKKHYTQLINHGETNKTIHDKSLSERFHDRYTVNENTGCWEWHEYHFLYPVIRFNGKMIRCNRLSYELYKGEIPEGMFVCHSCDNPSCVNPNHLWVGTHKQNMEDMSKKGRSMLGKKKPNKSNKED